MHDIDTYHLRIKTGQVLVGGNIFQNLDSAQKGEWLQSDDPCTFLYTHEEIRFATRGIVKDFIVPALSVSLEQFIFDAILIIDVENKYVYLNSDIHIFFYLKSIPRRMHTLLQLYVVKEILFSYKNLPTTQVFKY